MVRRSFLTLLACVLTSFAAFAASSITPYSKASFTDALNSGQTVIVHVDAGWCPTCAKQRPTIQSLAADPAMAKVAFVRVDFDNDTDFLTTYKVASQSTILVFRGGKEVARLNGVTDAAQIRQKLQAAVS
jgi:thioredoxin